MDRDQSQSYDPTESSEPGSRAKINEQALTLKEFRFSSEFERLRAVSKRTFSSGNRMAELAPVCETGFPVIKVDSRALVERRRRS